MAETKITQHTSGPWRLVFDDLRKTRNGGDCYAVIATEGGCIDIIGPSVMEDAHMANARLMSAAPALLEALRDLREATTDAYKAGRIPAEPFVRAGNVLAKAEGK